MPLKPKAEATRTTNQLNQIGTAMPLIMTSHPEAALTKCATATVKNTNPAARP